MYPSFNLHLFDPGGKKHKNKMELNNQEWQFNVILDVIPMSNKYIKI